MYRLIKLALASGITLFFFQNALSAAAQQNLHSAKTAASSPGPAAPNKPADASSTVASTAVVITVHGVCPEKEKSDTKDATSCNTLITRKEFEDMLAVLNPSGQPLPPNALQNLARTYAEFLALEGAARSSGLEENPQLRDLMNWVRLRTIADFYRRDLQEKYRTPPQEKVDAYYKQHLADFETVKLARILIPKEDLSARDKAEFEQKALAAANAAHERAARGDDISQIQKDAYSSLGLTTVPTTEMGTFRRANLTAREGEEVFALKPGGVSQVEVEPKSYVIYKVLSKDTPPEEQVKAEISREISQQKIKDAIKAATDAAAPEFNEHYFGPEILKPPPKVALPPREPAH